MTRSLLLKGLAGVAAIGGAVGGGLVAFNSGLLGGGKVKEQESKDLSKFNHKELIDKVGLSCGIEGDDIGGETKECSVKENGSINVRLGDQSEEEGVTFTNGSSKLKVSKSEGYSRELKFVVDSGDISLTKKDGGSSSIPKLEQFETYEVFLKEDGKFFLSRKTDSKEEKIKALELPTGEGKCSLPESGDSDCTLTIEEAKKVKFDGQNDGVTVTTGTVTLKISKVEDSSFTDGYRFTFTFPGDVTINNKKVKANTPYDFKIKKGESGNTLTLERVWSEDKEFAKKAGLECNGGQNECSVSSGSNLNIKVGEQKKEGITTTTGTGKIKMETEQEGYNQGLKFSITKGDVTISNGTGDAITKLEELETYEITEEGGKYYLTRKTSKDDGIKSSLVLPKGCDLPTSSTEDKTCTLDDANFKNINFDGKGESTTGSGTLTISKVTDTSDFPLGYRFTFSSEKEVTIANENKIKANIPTDFKIKKEDGKALSLEKAWSDNDYSLAKKVGLTCSSASGGEECCTKTGAEKLNVKKGTDTKIDITGTNGTGKIKVEKDQAGYNQGLKFTITGGSVSLTGGTHSGKDFTTLDEYETYEIKEEGGKYYLTRKDEASKTIGDLLGLPSNCKLSSACSLTSEQLQKINFKEKGTPTISTGNATLTISKATDATDFPLGYKFTLKSTTGDITIKDSENVVKKGISTDFKIKKETTAQNTTLSLEKAWTADSLGKKVGLKCCDDKTKECTIENNNKLNIKQDDKKDTNLSKSNSGSNGKIKVTKDQAGYNQGFKFTISDGNISLNGGSQTTDDKKIKHLEEYETYEIKEDGDKWYLVRKDKAQVFIKKALNIGDFCTGDFPKIGEATPETCNDIKDVGKLKNIKFHNMTSFTSWPSGTIDIQLSVERDTKSSNNNELKFTFTKSSSTSGEVCLPDGKGGSAKIETGGIEYKIKKTGTGENISLTLEKK